MPILTNQVGINIAKHAMQLVEISQKENKIYLENVDEEFFDEALEANLKETKFIHILQNAYNEIVLRNPLKTTNVLLSLPLSFFKTFEVPVDKNLTKNDLNDYTLWEFSKLFPAENKSEFYFQKIFLETPDYLSYKRELVFAINKDLLKRFYKFCVRNNLQLKTADISHLASNSILFYNNKKSNGISVLIEDTKISAMVFNQTNLVFSKTKNLNAISEVPIFIKDILLEIEKRNLKREKIEKLFLFGAKISNELLINIESSLNISSTIIEPFNELKLDIAHLNERLSIGNLTKYSSALGMALRLVS
ncbi:MAG: pilus assembly protein PilM [Ignavibacteriae bacterium]|nr:pilus assembly protein PilM [Ignavibacteriota bacterium]